MKRDTGPDNRLKRDAIYKIMSAMAGNRINFEEASRALYANDHTKFFKLIKPWPTDLQSHLKELLAG
jgi:hypothetical protein